MRSRLAEEAARATATTTSMDLLVVVVPDYLLVAEAVLPLVETLSCLAAVLLVQACVLRGRECGVLCVV